MHLLIQQWIENENCNVLNDDICSTLNTDDVDDCLLVVPTIPASTENNVETILLEINNIKMRLEIILLINVDNRIGQSNEDEVDQILDDLLEGADKIIDGSGNSDDDNSDK